MPRSPASTGPQCFLCWWQGQHERKPCGDSLPRSTGGFKLHATHLPQAPPFASAGNSRPSLGLRPTSQNSNAFPCPPPNQGWGSGLCPAPLPAGPGDTPTTHSGPSTITFPRGQGPSQDVSPPDGQAQTPGSVVSLSAQAPSPLFRHRRESCRPPHSPGLLS